MNLDDLELVDIETGRPVQATQDGWRSIPDPVPEPEPELPAVLSEISDPHIIEELTQDPTLEIKEEDGPFLEGETVKDATETKLRLEQQETREDNPPAPAVIEIVDDRRGQPEVKTTFALTATGPDGEVLAQSWDGGKTWKQTAAGEAFNERAPQRRKQIYTRKVMAVVEEPTAALSRRILTPFSVLDRMKVLTGWGPLATILQLEDDALDGVVLTGLLEESEMVALERVARSIILDIDAPMEWDRPMQDKMFAMLPYVTGMTVPTPLIASKMRPYHSRVFVVPHLIRRSLWYGVGTPPHRPVQIGVPHILDQAQQSAIELLRERYGERARWQSFDWSTLDPLQEVKTYTTFDITVLPYMEDRVQASLGPMLGPMAAQSVVVGDRSWSTINHRTNGLMVTRPDAKSWAQELNTVMQDRRLRLRMGRAARGVAMRHTAENKVPQVFLPYRVLVPESKPVQVEE